MADDTAKVEIKTANNIIPLLNENRSERIKTAINPEKSARRIEWTSFSAVLINAMKQIDIAVFILSLLFSFSSGMILFAVLISTLAVSSAIIVYPEKFNS
ncbi:hypothetical protein L6248_02525, partial [Candidatus Parcubacteria bacterium]|nr:hypothetical protein [Candidatus Parcubacteria bacterium]